MSSSSIDVKHFSNEISTLIKWKIENFTTQAPKETQTTLRSSSFPLYKSRLSFHLRFDSMNSGDKYKNYCGLYLFNSHLDNEKNVELRWRGWIENEDGKKMEKRKETSYKFVTENSGYGTPAIVKHSNLYPPESDFIKNNVVFICVEILQHKSQEWFKPIPLNDVEILKNYYKINQNCNKNSKGKGKLTIQMKNKKTFKVEKSLLALRSSVFEQMLQNKNFTEVKRNIMKIEDFEPEAMEAFVEFLHLEYVTRENLNYAHELLKLADKYNVLKLKDECCKILSKTFNKDNIFSLLITCFMHDCPQLKESALDYVSRDDSDASFKDIMKSDEWKEFTIENGLVSDEIVDAVFARVQWFKTKQNEMVPTTSSAP